MYICAYGFVHVYDCIHLCACGLCMSENLSVTLVYIVCVDGWGMGVYAVCVHDCSIWAHIRDYSVVEYFKIFVERWDFKV